MRRRLVSGVLVAATSLLAGAATASACESVGGSVSPGSAGPNDPITYSVSGLDSGATYRAVLEGQQMDSGVNGQDHGSAYGSFSMPNYGGEPRTVYVTLYASHSDDNFEWDRSFAVQYVPPARSSSGTPQGSSVSEPEKRVVRPDRARSQRPVVTAEHIAKKLRHDSATTGSPVGAAPADAVGSEPGPGDPSSGSGEANRSGSGEANRSAEESSSVPHRVQDAIGSTTRVGPAEVPTIGLLAMALIFIAGTALAAFVIYLLQSGPDPRAAIKAPAPLGPDPMEVELQEIIADEMARQLLSDLNLTERTPVRAS